MSRKDKFWSFVSPVENNPRGFFCDYCKMKFESGGSTKIKYHLAGVPGGSVRACGGDVPNWLISEALHALRALRKNSKTNSDSLASDDTGVLVCASSSKSNNFGSGMVPILKSVEDVMVTSMFFPKVSSAVYFYLHPRASFEVFDHYVLQLASTQFKGLVHSFLHMRALLAEEATLIAQSATLSTPSVDDLVGSTLYQNLVRYLVGQKEFWVDGKWFVKSFEPLLQSISDLAVSGNSIGFFCRSLETAKADYEMMQSRVPVFGRFKSLFERAVNPLSRVAAVLDPSLVFDVDFGEVDRLIAKEHLLLFKDSYVVDEDKVGFIVDVERYLEKSRYIFHCSADFVRGRVHPIQFWFWCGHGAPVLRKYALNLVAMPYPQNACSNDLKDVLSKEAVEGELLASCHLADLHPYQRGNVESLLRCVEAEESVEAGWVAVWEQLKLLDEACWSLIPDVGYYEFFLKVVLQLK